MRKLAAWLISALLLVATTGCSGGEASQTSGANQQKIRLGLSPWPGWFVWYLVKEKGGSWRPRNIIRSGCRRCVDKCSEKLF
ncbi:hypothetical protein [Effusibacillus pohliae]|uniref:hypothetical protein n=1 Tax=Effusibacillus pohliae TaxID=232270 RepID=UPI000371F81D|nr:hypothetical protein [Effusibacillus pohliae]